MKNIFFNAHHAPIGAFSSLTLGYKGAKGGLGKGLCKPCDTNFYIGLQNRNDENYKAFPFYDSVEDISKNFDVDKREIEKTTNILSPFTEAEREYELCSDKWTAEDIELAVYSQVEPIPNPETAKETDLKSVLVPSVLIEITVDNTKCDKSRKAFIGYEGSDPYFGMRHIKDENLNIKGIAQGGMTAIIGGFSDTKTANAFTVEKILEEKHEENYSTGLGNTSLIFVECKAGQKQTFQFAVCFFHDGLATKGIDAYYYYTKLFANIEEVGSFALAHFDAIKARCNKANDMIKSSLSEDKRFMMIHSIRSYYGATELLVAEDKPVWVVNEGEYRMLNTLDLTIDQIFFEMKMNPWTVRNVLDLYLKRYSYKDTVCLPNDERQYEGGITFTHDMGVSNIFSGEGQSSYEHAGLKGCFSYMSHEQLVNWLLCALVYAENNNDTHWINEKMDVIKECFQSMLCRDHFDENKRNGVMGLDSVKTKGGAEITTYDSLDVSLGQARNNVYLAGKCFGAYVSLQRLFQSKNLTELALKAKKQAGLCATTISKHLNAENYIPAVFENDNQSKIIPAMEGLIFPYFTGCIEALSEDGEYGFYIKALKKHFQTILVKGVCLFDDGGWKLSSTSNNSWLSKIYLCQFIARRILHINSKEISEKADAAHAAWLTHPVHSYWCWSDQIVSGEITASKYYPRGVTSILWLEESKNLY